MCCSENMNIQQLLVVCTGNICRSPLAEALIQKALPGMKVGSAGISALVGEPVDPAMRKIAKRYGVDLSNHVGQQMYRPMTDVSDAIFVMERHQRDFILSKYPHLLGRVFLLSHFTGGSMKGAEVRDPYRREISAYEDCAKEISLHVESLTSALTRTPHHGSPLSNDPEKSI